MSSYTQPIQNLMNELSRLPGIGMRSAERIAFHLLKLKPEDAMRLALYLRLRAWEAGQRAEGVDVKLELDAVEPSA